jgi:DNA-directed RNA polymerase III subunit RPC8
MFVLTKIRHSVRLHPMDWNRPLPEAVKDALNRTMANTVVHKIGLFVAVFDLLRIDESFILAGDGCSHTSVTFRAVVFRPFVEEVVVGRIKSCSKTEGVAVSLGFFDDIVIPPEALQHPYRFDENEQVSEMKLVVGRVTES